MIFKMNDKEHEEIIETIFEFINRLIDKINKLEENTNCGHCELVVKTKSDKKDAVECKDCGKILYTFEQMTKEEHHRLSAIISSKNEESQNFLADRENNIKNKNFEKLFY